MDQVEKAFNGRYREVNRETQQWYTYNHPVPEPRPGMVSTCLLPSAGNKNLTVSSVTSQLYSLYWYLHLYYNTPHPSCLKWFSFIYTVSLYLVILSQQNQQKVNKSCCTGFIDMSVIKMFTSPVYHERSQDARYTLLTPHAWQGAKFRQRPLPDGQRHPQFAPPAETKCSLHADCRPSSPDRK